MQSDEVQQFYAQKASLYLRFVRLLKYSGGLKAFLLQSGYVRPDMRILDAGCGSGTLTRAIHTLALEKGFGGMTFHAFDLTPAMLDLFREWIAQENAEGIELRQANVLLPEELPGEWSGHDLVVSSGMLEYLPKDELKDGLQHLRKRLKGEGTVLVFITRRNYLMRWIIQAWWKANMYEKDEIRQVFHDAGFGSVEFKRFPTRYSYLHVWGFIIEAKP